MLLPTLIEDWAERGELPVFITSILPPHKRYPKSSSFTTSEIFLTLRIFFVVVFTLQAQQSSAGIPRFLPLLHQLLTPNHHCRITMFRALLCTLTLLAADPSSFVWGFRSTFVGSSVMSAGRRSASSSSSSSSATALCMKTIAVFGASGLTAQECVYQALKNGDNVVGLTR